MRKILLSLGCLWAGAASAASLSDMLCAAEAGAPHVPQIRAEAEIAGAQVAQARAAFRPALSLQATRSRTESALSTDLASGQVKASWVVFDAQARAVLAQAEHRNRAAAVGVQYGLEQFSEEVVLRHLRVLSARESVQVARAQVAHWQHMHGLAKELKQVGRAIGLDQQRAAASWAQAEATLAEAELALRKAEDQFKLVSPAGVEGPDLVALEAWLQTLVLAAPGAMQQTAQQQALVAASAAAVEVAQGARLPTLSVVGTRAIAETDSGLGRVRQQQWDLGLSVQIPLYAGGGLAAKEAQARAQYQQQVAAARQVEAEEQAALAQQLEAVRTQGLVLRATAAGVLAARSAAEVALGRYAAGVGPLDEVTQTQSQLRGMLLDEVSAKTELIATTLELLKLQGRLVAVLKDGKC